MAAVEELRDSLRFLGVENVEEDILNSMIETAGVLGMKPSEMGDSWMAHSLNNSGASLNFDNWMAFKTELNRSLANRMTRKRPSNALTPSAIVNSPSVGIKPSFQSPFAAKTPLAAMQQSLLLSQDLTDVSSPGTTDPAAIGTSVFQYTMQNLPSDSPSLLMEEKWWGSGEPPSTSAHLIKMAPSPFRYMLQKPSEIVLALNEHLEWLEHEAFPQPVETKEEPVEESQRQPTNESTRMIGRLVLSCSNEANEGTGSGVSLQGSLESSAGTETPLHVLPTACSGFSLCQGQVVACNGTSAQTSKRLFLVDNIQLPLLPPPFVSNLATKDNDFLALIAAGPFSAPKLAIQAVVTSLATVVRRFTPTIVILIGPFGSGNLFNICRDINSLNQASSTMFSIIPSHSDLAVGTPPVFPTPSIDATFAAPKALMNDGKTLVMSPPDPAMIDVNGAMICATSVDILRHLASSELHLGTAAPGGGDRLSRLASTLIYQRCMYPLYPQAQSIPVDWPLWRKLATIPNLPSIVILPSDLNPFISPFTPVGGKTPERGSLLVNPGRVSRHRAALVRWSAKDQAFTAGRIIRV